MCGTKKDWSGVKCKNPCKIVYSVKVPAYVVKEIVREVSGVNVILGGCLVAWNEEFERITNLVPSDIAM